MNPTMVGGKDQPATGLAWSLRERGQATAEESCADPPCDWSAAQVDGSWPSSSLDPHDGSDVDVRAAAEDAAETRSLFAKIVDLVTPPSASPSAADSIDNRAAPDHSAQQDVDASTNFSDGGGNSTSSKASTREQQQAHERAHVNTTKDGAAGAASDSGAEPPEVEMDAQKDEPDTGPGDLLEPVNIAPDIFAELIPSIHGTGDPCAIKCTINTCSGHGVCAGPLCQCNCSAQYTGHYCHELVAQITHFTITPPKKPCPDNCTGQGDCLSNGTCSCNKVHPCTYA